MAHQFLFLWPFIVQSNAASPPPDPPLPPLSPPPPSGLAGLGDRIRSTPSTVKRDGDTQPVESEREVEGRGGGAVDGLRGTLGGDDAL